MGSPNNRSRNTRRRGLGLKSHTHTHPKKRCFPNNAFQLGDLCLLSGDPCHRDTKAPDDSNVFEQFVHFCLVWIGARKTNKHKTYKHFSDGPCGTIVPRDEPPPVPGTNGTKWRFYCGIQQKTADLSQGRVPVCPGDSSCLS